MIRKNSCVILRKKIKRLLEEGKKSYRIAKELNLSRSRVERIVKDIVNGKKRWNKKTSVLNAHMDFIQKLIQQEKSHKEIFNALKARKVKVHPTTVFRFVKSIILSKKPNKLSANGNPEATVSFTYIGKFHKRRKKLDVWIFCMQLKQSYYTYYKEVTDATVATFINCHLKAFSYFKGVPHVIYLNNIDQALNKRDCFLQVYSLFIKHFNIQQKTTAPGDDETCYRKMKNFFLTSLIHKQYAQLSQELNAWAERNNLDRHSHYDKSVKKVFEAIEQPSLLRIKPHPSVGSCSRKASSKGYVFFEYNWYEVPKQFRGRVVQILFYYKSVKIYFEEKIIASFLRNYTKGNKIKLYEH